MKTDIRKKIQELEEKRISLLIKEADSTLEKLFKEHGVSEVRLVKDPHESETIQPVVAPGIRFMQDGRTFRFTRFALVNKIVQTKVQEVVSNEDEEIFRAESDWTPLYMLKKDDDIDINSIHLDETVQWLADDNYAWESNQHIVDMWNDDDIDPFDKPYAEHPCAEISDDAPAEEATNHEDESFREKLETLSKEAFEFAKKMLMENDGSSCIYFSVNDEENEDNNDDFRAIVSTGYFLSNEVNNVIGVRVAKKGEDPYGEFPALEVCEYIDDDEIFWTDARYLDHLFYPDLADFVKRNIDKAITPEECEALYADEWSKAIVPMGEDEEDDEDDEEDLVQDGNEDVLRLMFGNPEDDDALLYGLIDNTGSSLVEPQFESTLPFSEGLAAAKEQNGLWGYIDKTGAWVIKPRFNEAYSFSEGLAAVHEVEGLWGFIDHDGVWTIRPQFDRIESFSEGLAAVSTHDDMRYGYIDKTGTWVIKPQFRRADSFSEGLAVAINDYDILCRCGYIDKTGAWVIKPQFHEACAFSEGRAEVLGDSGDCGYIDKTGALVTKDKFESIESFSEGLAAVKKHDGLWGFIDREGVWVIKPQFDRVDSFSEGLARVDIDGEWGYIDKTGSLVIEPQFDMSDSFSEGLARVGIAGEWGYIDKSGTLVIRRQFEEASNFKEGVAWVEPS